MHELMLGRITVELTQGKMSLAVERRLRVRSRFVFVYQRSRQSNSDSGPKERLLSNTANCETWNDIKLSFLN